MYESSKGRILTGKVRHEGVRSSALDSVLLVRQDVQDGPHFAPPRVVHALRLQDRPVAPLALPRLQKVDDGALVVGGPVCIQRRGPR